MDRLSKYSEECRALADECVGLDRLRELAEADRDGRLAVRPYRIGETVYALLKDGAIFYPETNGWYMVVSIIIAVYLMQQAMLFDKSMDWAIQT